MCARLLGSFQHLDTLVSEVNDLPNKLACRVHLGYIVGASQAHPVDHNIGHGPSAGRLKQLVLQSLPLEMGVKFNHVGFGCNIVLFNQYALGTLREGTVGL